MENRYSLFTKITAFRCVHKVIDDILTQRVEFSSDLNETKQLDPQKTWLLQQLENQHQKRTSQAIDLSTHPLLLILELSAYLSRGKNSALSALNEQDGLSNSISLHGAEIGANLLRAYVAWVKHTQVTQTQVSNLTCIDLGEDNKQLDELAKAHGLQDENGAPKLASNFVH